MLVTANFFKYRWKKYNLRQLWRSNQLPQQTQVQNWSKIKQWQQRKGKENKYVWLAIFCLLYMDVQAMLHVRIHLYVLCMTFSAHLECYSFQIKCGITSDTNYEQWTNCKKGDPLAVMGHMFNELIDSSCPVALVINNRIFGKP